MVGGGTLTGVVVQHGGKDHSGMSLIICLLSSNRILLFTALCVFSQLNYGYENNQAVSIFILFALYCFQHISSMWWVGVGYKAVGGGVGVGLQGQAKHIQFKYANVITGSGNKKHGTNEGEQRTTQDLI